MEQRRETGRVGGLDVLRALAILMVIVAHYPKPETGLVSRMLNFGWTGVDLFFVLSGYLIGGQLFIALARGQQISLGGFYLRRFLRTLPSYYAVLTIYAVLPSLTGTAAPAPLWRFATFLQNFSIPPTFSPSWSLCVEEHFYLLFPVAVLVLARWSRPGMVPVLLGGILAGEIVVRAAIWCVQRPDLMPDQAGLAAFMGSLYYPTYCRLDGITLGVGLAALKYFQPGVWKRLTQRGDLLLAGAFFFLAVAVLAFWQRYSFLCSTVGFTCISLCFAFLTAGVLSEHHWLGRLRVPGAASVALLSYSIYLTHSLAMEYAGWLAGRFGLVLQSGSGLLTAAALILLFSTFLHYLVERPFLSLRDRLWGARKGRSCPTALLPVPETQ